MFGHDHKDEDNNNDNTVQPMSTQPVSHGLLGIDDDDTAPAQSSDAPASEPAAAPVPDSSSSYSDDTPSVPTTPSFSAPEPAVDEITAVSTPDAPKDETPSSDNDDDLLDIKREALEELSPLIDHLEQDSEEKFRTTMMMIQASDNKTLVPQAFAAAKAITDDAKRAQALLDIVNEINYFTQKHAE